MDRIANTMRIIFILALFLPAMVTAQSLSQKNTLSFMMITQRLAEDPFWGVVEDIAIAASKDFDIDLHIRHAESDRSNLLKFVDEAAKSKLDAVIFPNFKNVAPEIIELAEKLEIPVFLFNAGVLSKNLPRTGKPREKFKFWIGESLPNDEFAGFLLAKTLIAQAKQQNLFDANGIVQIVGITGTVSEMPSLLRKQGLERAVREDKRALLNQVVFANWSKELASLKMQALYKRYPETTIFWAASDLMAIGVAEKLEALGLRPGVDVLTGGVDWTIEGLQALAEDKIAASIGGHIFEGAWAIILLYDYFKGLDFVGLQPEQFPEPYLANSNIVVPMETIKEADIDSLLERIENKHWDELNFQNFSRFENPEIDTYDFSLHKLLTRDLED